MSVDKIPPEFRTRLRWIPHLRFGNPVVRSVMAVIFRLLSILQFRGDARVKTRWEYHGEAGCKIYEPVNRTGDAAILWIHGGGYIALETWLDDYVCRRLAEKHGITVVSAEYRRAPKHPFPAALDDCRASWHWLQGHAEELGVDPWRVIIAGESAGGGLTAALAQRLHDEGGVQPIAQVIVCPMLDDRTALREDLNVINYHIWDNGDNHAGWSLYLGQQPGLPDVPPYAVPARRESLAGLPPAWLGIGTADVFLDESREYVNRLQTAGVETEYFEAEGGVHAFQGLVPEADISVAFWDSLDAFIRRVLAIPAIPHISTSPR